VRLAFTIVGAITLLFLSPFFTNKSLFAAVVINELYPKVEPATQEWIELYNNGTESVSLDRWKLDHTAGDAKSFILPANANIQPHGFLTFYGSQTAINFSVEGDTVRFFDVNGTLVDSQSYPSILGYNTSMGRSSDGGGTWALCTTATYNIPNNCPQPSPTPTPIPTNTSTPTPTPLPTKTPTRTPTSTPARLTFGSLLPSPTQTQILGVADTTSPTPTPDLTSLTLKIDKILVSRILFVAIAWGVIAVVIYVRHKKRHRQTAP
jgi:hypothetical protein